MTRQASRYSQGRCDCGVNGPLGHDESFGALGKLSGTNSPFRSEQKRHNATGRFPSAVTLGVDGLERRDRFLDRQLLGDRRAAVAQPVTQFVIMHERSQC